jgi:Lipocalin-like domain
MKKLLLVLLVSIFFSCKKDKTCNKDMAGISGTYKVTAFLYKANSATPETDIFALEVPDLCDRDDTFTFNANGTVIFTDAGVKCVPPNDDTGTWSVTGNTFDVDGTINTIHSFNCSTLVFIETNYNVAGDQLLIVLTRQ